MENTLQSPTTFDRHASMSGPTRSDILRLTSVLEYGHNAPALVNWLYGALDGWDYSDQAFESAQLAHINYTAPSLGAEILEIFATISTYPRTTYPNNGNH